MCVTKHTSVDNIHGVLKFWTTEWFASASTKGLVENCHSVFA